MKYIIRLFIVLCVAFVAQTAWAQPPARKKAQAQEQQTTSSALTERAKAQYPVQTTPEDVIWKREIYRSIDLTKEKNAPLYYPVTPNGKYANLFTILFRLVVSGQVSAYQYNTDDGYEQLTPDKKMKVRDILEDQSISYTRNKDSSYVVSDVDIPNNEVLTYFIKECYYFDQRTATYNRRVEALCPVLTPSSEFSVDAAKHPMFWLKYDEVSPYLEHALAMTSSYNNIQTMSYSDFFTKNQYEGDIYLTVNLRGLSLSQYCPTDSAMKKEQQNIEKQLADFHDRLWKGKQDSVATDSSAVAKDNKVKAKRTRTTRTKTTKSKVDKSSGGSSSSSSSGSPRVSVRRQRH